MSGDRVVLIGLFLCLAACGDDEAAENATRGGGGTGTGDDGSGDGASNSGDGDSGDSGASDEPPADDSQPQWGDCAGSFDACQADVSICANHQHVDGLCGEDESGQLGFCTDNCTDDGDCPAPTTGDAAPTCGTHESVSDAAVCFLDCGAGQTCPDGMECVPRSRFNPDFGMECSWQRCIPL